MTEHEQDFWTKNIVLQDKIPQDTFNIIRLNWSYDDRMDHDDTYVLFSNPIISDSYRELIDMFLAHPRAAKLKVFERHIGWQTNTPKSINPNLADKLSRIAAANEERYNHFEMEFLPSDANAKGIETRARLKFGLSVDGLIVGYEFSVHKINLNLFDDSNVNYRLRATVSGVFLPDY